MDDRPLVESWRPVPGFPSYRVSDLGRLQSSRSRNGAPLPGGRWRDVVLTPDGQGYPGQHLTEGPRRRWFNVHQLVLLAFVGPCPGGMVGRHVDNPDPWDNRLANLAYGSQVENCADKRRHGTAQTAARRRRYITPAQADEYLRRALAGESCSAIAGASGHSAFAVRAAVRRARNRARNRAAVGVDGAVGAD